MSVAPYLARLQTDYQRRIVGPFITEGTYSRAAGGAGVPLNVSFGDPYAVNETFPPGVQDGQATLRFSTADLPAPPPVHGDSWTDGVTTWFVIEVMPNPRIAQTVCRVSRDPSS